MKKMKSITLLGATAALAALIPLSAYAATTTPTTPTITPTAPVAAVTPAVTPAVAPKAEVSQESATETPEVKGAPEAQDPNEQAKLQQAATLTQAQATASALQQVPGTVKSVQLEDENGTVVYGVQIVDASGKGFDVKVDAKTGKVLKSDSDSNDGSEGTNGTESTNGTDTDNTQQ
jgi:uncharacterized membrane protein YkoI